MKAYVVYMLDRWDMTEYGHRYFLSQEKAMNYYEKVKKIILVEFGIGMKSKWRINHGILRSV